MKAIVTLKKYVCNIVKFVIRDAWGSTWQISSYRMQWIVQTRDLLVDKRYKSNTMLHPPCLFFGHGFSRDILESEFSVRN